MHDIKRTIHISKTLRNDPVLGLSTIILLLLVHVFLFVYTSDGADDDFVCNMLTVMFSNTMYRFNEMSHHIQSMMAVLVYCSFSRSYWLFLPS